MHTHTQTPMLGETSFFPINSNYLQFAESGDTLAKPEFEGIWDKHKPYRAPKDNDGEIKLPGASKMEKVGMSLKV